VGCDWLMACRLVRGESLIARIGPTGSWCHGVTDIIGINSQTELHKYQICGVFEHNCTMHITNHKIIFSRTTITVAQYERVSIYSNKDACYSKGFAFTMLKLLQSSTTLSCFLQNLQHVTTNLIHVRCQGNGHHEILARWYQTHS
jgi:hypothetical protein